MNKSLAAVISILFCLCFIAPAKAGDNKDLSGTWSGTYTCIQGLTGLTLTFKKQGPNRFSGEFSFFPLPSNPEAKKGRYEIYAKRDSSGAIRVTIGRWLDKPDGYNPVGLRGDIDREGREFSGKVTAGGCSSFTVVRDAASNTDIASDTLKSSQPKPNADAVSSKIAQDGVDGGSNAEQADTQKEVAASSDDLSPIVIGISGPFSISGDHFEKQMKMGAQLAADAINAAGGAGRRQIKLIFGDDKNEPGAAIALANHFVAEGVSFAVGAPTSGLAIATSEIYEKNGVVLITPMAPAVDYSERNLWNVFRIWNRRDRQGALAGGYIADSFKDPRVLLISDGSDDSEQISDVTRWNLNASDIREIGTVQIDASKENFPQLVSKLQKDGVTVVHYSGDHIGAAAIVHEMAVQGAKAQFIGTDLMFDNALIEDVDVGRQDVLITMDDDLVAQESARDVVDRFRQLAIQPEPLALTTYAAVQTIAQAISLTGGSDAYAVSQTLKQNGPFETVTGPVSFDQKGDLTRLRYSVYRLQKDDSGRMAYAVAFASRAENPAMARCLATIRAAIDSLLQKNVDDCREALVVDPKTPRLQLALGRALMNNGGSAEAAKLFFQAASEGNDPAAAYHYSLLLEQGEGLPKDLKKAAEIRQIAANFGNTHAEFRIGRDLIRVMDKKGVEWLTKAAKKGHILAHYELAQLYGKGELVEKDQIAKVELMSKAAMGSNATAQYLLGLYYQIGANVDKDLFKSTELFRRAANQGMASAQYELGDARYFGSGIEKDSKLAAMWFQRAAEQNDKRAQFALSRMIQAGEGGVPKDSRRSFELLLASAKQDYPDALWHMGLTYEHGDFPGKDLKTAYVWYEKAANADLAQAMFKMGLAESLGVVGPANEKKAFDWYVKAAGKNHTGGMELLALAYQNGLGTQKDLGKAIEWYTKAAEKGSGEGQLQSGLLLIADSRYQNLKMGKEWLERASQNKDEGIRKRATEALGKL